ncbi:MAG: transporter substrate-binding domain-containing protein [Deltaproteobacteria bacterium]|nr:transporter substrate-binding domain-containing protein [Deltaproteobacteria bacterium]
MMKIKAMGVLSLTICLLSLSINAFGDDMPEIKKKGVLRHLGVPYANFVTGSGDGFSVELMQGFSKYLGVRYAYVQTSWSNVIQDLSGKKVRPRGVEVEILGHAPIRGDVVATGLTILPWREKVIDYSIPTFPTQIWLLARAESSLQPIKSTGDTERDIEMVKSLLKGRSVLGVTNTCLDPNLYGIRESGAKVILFQEEVNKLSPAVIRGDAETCIYEVPDALNALKKWPGRLKVIGPLSGEQAMACGFRKSFPRLREAFNQYLVQSKRNGSYLQLINKYYEDVLLYFPRFLK